MLNAKLMSTHSSSSSSSWCFNNGDSPLLLVLFVSSISNRSDELALVTTAVRGNGTGWFTRIHGGSFSEPTLLLQIGHVCLLRNTMFMQRLWNMCPHCGSFRTSSSIRNSSKQIRHLQLHQPNQVTFTNKTVVTTLLRNTGQFTSITSVVRGVRRSLS